MSGLVENDVEEAAHDRLSGLRCAVTRDLLLPALMSGKIRLREAEKVVEALA